MYSLVLLLHVIISVLLIFIILIQQSKGEGLAGAFGTGGGQAIFGTRTGDVLTKATTVMAVIFMVTSLSLAFLTSKTGVSVMKKTTALKTASSEESSAGVIPSGKSDVTTAKNVLSNFTDKLVNKMQGTFNKEKTDAAEKEQTVSVDNPAQGAENAEVNTQIPTAEISREAEMSSPDEKTSTSANVTSP